MSNQDVTDYTARISARDVRRNGLSPFCAPAFRRCCGVCAHFRGTLNGPAAPCGKWDTQVRPDKSARFCNAWTRK